MPRKTAMTAAKEKLSKDMIESTAEARQRLRDLSSIGSGAACLIGCADGETTIKGSTSAMPSNVVDAMVWCLINHDVVIT